MKGCEELRCKLTIPGLLPGLNEYIEAERGKKASIKRHL